ncbi:MULTISPECIES: protein kinase [Streptomyces]|uniref:Serine/threonine protein kinase n=2 Tax=Streptomyces TaxID=1883 RepID=A0A5P2BKM5_STRVZ|nr:protein kinase [Streptomyces venezuelae]MYY80164.1 protein kinase [Streptomyces sp. SID335]MYZ13061.1 protein kinase [Streptomyces sp. SID337]NEB46464.1 protein kinase [Streptomyces sp. SID339]QES28919.1 serine/threonine protein kinase [Streptomyces venezuelae]
MDDYAGRVLADRYRLPLPPSDVYEFAESRAFDTYSGQEVLVRQVPLPEIVEAEVVGEDGLDDLDGLPDGFLPRAGAGGPGGRRSGARRPGTRTTRRPTDPAVRRAIEAAQTAAQIPDHPRLDQVFDVFAEDGSLWIVSELVAARPLAALLADRPLSPYRAAEVAADVLAALRVLHAYGWVHRNITARTVLICDDGRVMLTGLAAGAAEEALCGYDPRPVEAGEATGSAGSVGNVAEYETGHATGLGRGYGAADEDEDGDVALEPAPEPESEPAGRISDPYGVADKKPWHGAVPRGGVPGARGRDANEAPRRSEDRRDSEVPYGNARGGWDDGDGEGTPLRGPATALAAERARLARMVVVGAVTERWAPEQAGPVHENWQLAAPIAPATDLWALGALLYRAVQGHAPYPEDSTAELVQLVCAEPPAFAEECGPLRPVVESLLRQDPTERPDFEELSGWLRSLVRSAPEPEAGAHVVPVPPYDAGRLPVVRRRGEVVRRRKSPARNTEGHGRHKRGRGRGGRAQGSRPGHDVPDVSPLQGHSGPRAPREAHPRGPARPRSLGRLLLIAILLGLAAAIAYAMVFMPKSDDRSSDRAGTAGEVSSAPRPGDSKDGKDGEKDKSEDKNEGKEKDGSGRSPGSQKPQTSGPEVPQGFVVRKDPEGFHVAVAGGWDRQPKNGRGQVRYTHGGFELLLVPGRDTTDSYGDDPMKYQREHERELQPFRDSSWATSSGMRRIDVGGRVMAEGQFTWQDDAGREVFVRNLAMIVGGRYHVVQVRGPEAERDEVTRLYEQASATYRVTD